MSRDRRSPARPGASHTPSRPCGAACASSCSRRRARSLSSPRRGRAPRSRASSSSGARETGPPSWRTSSQWALTRRPPSRSTRSPRLAAPSCACPLSCPRRSFPLRPPSRRKPKQRHVGPIAGWSACPCANRYFFRAQTRNFPTLKPANKTLSNTPSGSTPRASRRPGGT